MACGISFFISVLNLLSDHNSCTQDFEQFEGSCYRCMPYNKNYVQAIALCRRMSAKLASISNEAENVFIQAM